MNFWLLRTLAVFLTLAAWAETEAPQTLPRRYQLRASVEADGEGVFLSQILKPSDGFALPAVRLADPPQVGVPLVWTRQFATQLIEAAMPGGAAVEWSGSLQITISRRARVLAEAEVQDRLRQAIQDQWVRGRGELDLRLARPWMPVSIPDDPCEIKVLDIPTTGVSPAFNVRFELANSRGRIGSWQCAVAARIWREVFVARTSLQRGEIPAEDDFVLEKRDLLATRDPLTELPKRIDAYITSESIQMSQALTSRSLKLRPVVKRGQMLDATINDGTLAISLKVEALEDAVPGQLVRLRNTQTRRELRGRIKNEQTVELVL